jgi:hypothetical protein
MDENPPGQVSMDLFLKFQNKIERGTNSLMEEEQIWKKREAASGRVCR